MSNRKKAIPNFFILIDQAEVKQYVAQSKQYLSAKDKQIQRGKLKKMALNTRCSQPIFAMTRCMPQFLWILGLRKA